MGVHEELNLEDTQRFLDHNASDPVSIEIRDANQKKIEFNGLSKEEVMKFGSDPKWVRIRWALFILFWILWVGMLAASILVVVFSPRCPYRPNQAWYEKEAVYKIDVEYFKDSDGNGKGDINGLINSLNYIDRIGAKTICLGKSILSDDDPRKIEFGTLDDMKVLRKNLDSKDMYLIMDIPAKHFKTDADSLLNYWLTSLADGVQITNIEAGNQVQDLSEITRKIEKKTFKQKLIIFESSSINNTAKTHFSDRLASVDEAVLKNPDSFIKSLQEIYPSNKLPVFYSLGNRPFDRFKSFGNLFHALSILIKGNPILSNGDELEFSGSDKYMKWDRTRNCGFSSNNETLVNQKCDNSARDAFADGSGITLADLYQTLLNLKREPSFNWGEIKFSDKNEIVSYNREADRFDGYVVAANTDKDSHLVDFQGLYGIPEESEVEFFYSTNANDDFVKGKIVQNSHIKMKSGEFLVLKYKRNEEKVSEKASVQHH